MTKLLVMTDLHLRHGAGQIIGLDPAQQLRKALAHAIEHHPDAEALVLTGDLAHNGHPDAYQLLSDILSACPMPIIPLLGNHDNRTNFLAAFPDTHIDPNGYVQSYRDFGNTRAIFLDTLDGETKGDLYHSGILCPDRIAWLTARLDQSLDRQVLLFMHHPPFKTGFVGMDAIRLRNDTEFLDLLSGYQNIAHLIVGHIHRTISGSVKGASYSILKSTCHQMPLLFEPEDPSLSVAEPAAYGVILTSDNSITVHSEDFEIAQHSLSHEPSALGN